jgi:hypothetical protein
MTSPIVYVVNDIHYDWHRFSDTIFATADRDEVNQFIDKFVADNGAYNVEWYNDRADSELDKSDTAHLQVMQFGFWQKVDRD